MAKCGSLDAWNTKAGAVRRCTVTVETMHWRSGTAELRITPELSRAVGVGLNELLAGCGQLWRAIWQTATSYTLVALTLTTSVACAAGRCLLIPDGNVTTAVTTTCRTIPNRKGRLATDQPLPANADVTGLAPEGDKS